MVLVASLRPVVSEPPASTAFTLPEGYLEFSGITFKGQEASLACWLGPIQRPQPGLFIFSCGTGYAFSLEWRAEAWAIASVSITQC